MEWPHWFVWLSYHIAVISAYKLQVRSIIGARETPPPSPPTKKNGRISFLVVPWTLSRHDGSWQMRA